MRGLWLSKCLCHMKFFEKKITRPAQASPGQPRPAQAWFSECWNLLKIRDAIDWFYLIMLFLTWLHHDLNKFDLVVKNGCNNLTWLHHALNINLNLVQKTVLDSFWILFTYAFINFWYCFLPTPYYWDLHIY